MYFSIDIHVNADDVASRVSFADVMCNVLHIPDRLPIVNSGAAAAAAADHNFSIHACELMTVMMFAKRLIDFMASNLH